jgi:hypothetical protein
VPLLTGELKLIGIDIFLYKLFYDIIKLHSGIVSISDSKRRTLFALVVANGSINK